MKLRKRLRRRRKSSLKDRQEAIQALFSTAVSYKLNYSALNEDLRKALLRFACPAWVFAKRTRPIERR